MAWDEHPGIRAENEAEWLCAYHAYGDESVLPTATVADLLDVGELFRQLNSEMANKRGESPQLQTKKAG